MFFVDYKHIELLENDIAISCKRVDGKKISAVKNWKPTSPFRLKVKATVVKNGQRKIKKRTFLYENIYMVDALKEAEKELDTLLDEIHSEFKAPVPQNDDKNEKMSLGKAFMRSLDFRNWKQ
ncbi:hypothetical protein [Sulfurovum sp.]|uniref:hypothetical protein n=1 Tax=Sulfurovum sp. TaxID=1969726 RepID=UPI002867BB0B|nr:hypothetical protein [Sulfurovum sp.]